MYAKQEEQWYEYDDNVVQNVPGETAMNCDTYIAFLTRKNRIETMNEDMRHHIQILRTNELKRRQPAEEA